jgi:hypothetical protein
LAARLGLSSLSYSRKCVKESGSSNTNTMRACRGAIKSGRVCAIKSGIMFGSHCQLELIL